MRIALCQINPLVGDLAGNANVQQGDLGKWYQKRLF